MLFVLKQSETYIYIDRIPKRHVYTFFWADEMFLVHGDQTYAVWLQSGSKCVLIQSACCLYWKNIVKDMFFFNCLGHGVHWIFYLLISSIFTKRLLKRKVIASNLKLFGWYADFILCLVVLIFLLRFWCYVESWCTSSWKPCKVWYRTSFYT